MFTDLYHIFNLLQTFQNPVFLFSLHFRVNLTVHKVTDYIYESIQVVKIIVVVKEAALPYVFFDILKLLLYEALFSFLRENNIRGQHEFLVFITGKQK